MSETLAALSDTPQELRDLVAALEQSKLLDAPRAPGKWSPRQILAHLADVETLQNVRMLGVLAAPETPMLAFDADAWAASGQYEQRDAAQSLAVFCALRERNLELWKALTPTQLQTTALHPKRGAFALQDWLAFVVMHDAGHVAQLRQSLESKPTTKPA
jgi:hypothetical protein